jgi:hypothetical protein
LEIENLDYIGMKVLKPGDEPEKTPADSLNDQPSNAPTEGGRFGRQLSNELFPEMQVVAHSLQGLHFRHRQGRRKVNAWLLRIRALPDAVPDFLHEHLNVYRFGHKSESIVDKFSPILSARATGHLRQRPSSPAYRPGANNWAGY